MIKRNSGGEEWKSVARKRSKFGRDVSSSLHPLAEGGNARRTNRHTNQLLWLQAQSQTQKETTENIPSISRTTNISLLSVFSFVFLLCGRNFSICNFQLVNRNIEIESFDLCFYIHCSVASDLILSFSLIVFSLYSGCWNFKKQQRV